MRSTFPALVSLLLASSAGALAQDHSDANGGLVRNALRAAPTSVTAHATVADFQGNVLRPGTNGWVCMPDMPEMPNDSPMCLDATWREVIDAWMHRRAPDYHGTGIGYMLIGDMPVSNLDPFATAPAPGNEWLADGEPHIMIAISDKSMLDGLPTDPNNGGPWVMWRGTPYAHIMIPMDPPTR